MQNGNTFYEVFLVQFISTYISILSVKYITNIITQEYKILFVSKIQRFCSFYLITDFSFYFLRSFEYVPLDKKRVMIMIPNLNLIQKFNNLSIYVGHR